MVLAGACIHTLKKTCHNIYLCYVHVSKGVAWPPCSVAVDDTTCVFDSLTLKKNEAIKFHIKKEEDEDKDVMDIEALDHQEQDSGH